MATRFREAVPSISAVARYELVDPAGSGPSYRYLTVYELDDADIPAAVAAMNESAVAGKIDMSPAMDLAQRPPGRSGTGLTRPELGRSWASSPHLPCYRTSVGRFVRGSS
jgi:hypothetical protein